MSELKSPEEIREAVKDFQASEAWWTVSAIAFLVTCVATVIATAYDISSQSSK